MEGGGLMPWESLAVVSFILASLAERPRVGEGEAALKREVGVSVLRMGGGGVADDLNDSGGDGVTLRGESVRLTDSMLMKEIGRASCRERVSSPV